MIAESPALLHSARPACPLHVLTLTPFFPVADDNAQGCFVSDPLPWTAQHGVTNTVVAVDPFYREKQLPEPEGARSLRLRYVSLPGGWGLSSAGYLLFRRLLPRLRALHTLKPIELIHAHSALPCGHAAQLLSRVMKIPFVVTVHGLDAFSTVQVRGRAGELCESVTRRVYQSARKVICVSATIRDRVLERAPDASTAVIYNGVDEKLFAPSDRSSPPDSILSVGNLIEIKGHDVTLRALARICSKRPETRLQVIGEGPQKAALQRMAAELGVANRVKFVDRQSRRAVADAMRASALFALPSSYEGLGCVYLEAMSCAKPVIGCYGQGISEIIKHGENGFLSFPGDDVGLSDIALDLLETPGKCQSVGRRARNTILQKHTLAHQAAQLAHSYHEACR